jgi:hypothetical protein
MAVGMLIVLTAVVLMEGLTVGEMDGVGVPVGWAVLFLELFLLCLVLELGVDAGLTLELLEEAVSARLI